MLKSLNNYIVVLLVSSPEMLEKKYRRTSNTSCNVDASYPVTRQQIHRDTEFAPNPQTTESVYVFDRRTKLRLRAG
jgi:hypothetical protein